MRGAAVVLLSAVAHSAGPPYQLWLVCTVTVRQPAHRDSQQIVQGRHQRF